MKSNVQIFGLTGVFAIAFALLQGDLFGDQPAEWSPEQKLQNVGATIEKAENLPGKPIIAVGLPYRSSRGLQFRATDQELSALAELPQLQRIDLSGADVSANGLDQLKVLKGLRELNLYNSVLTEQKVKALAKITSLKVLDLSHSRMNTSCVRALAPLTSLEVLNVSGENIDGSCIGIFRNFEKLRVLHLGGWDIDEVNVKKLVELQTLQELTLCGVHALTDKGLAELKGLRSLEILDLRWTRLSDAGLKEIGQLPNLKELRVHDVEITCNDPFLRFLGRSTCRCGVSNKGIRFLAEAKKLEKLDLSGTIITRQGIQHLQDLPSLREIRLDDLHISQRDVQELQKKMPRIRFIHTHVITEI